MKSIIESVLLSAIVGLFFSPRLNAQGCPLPKLLSISHPNQITLGDWADVEVNCLNSGTLTSPDGGISISFPSFTDSSDGGLVANNGSSSGSAKLTIYPKYSTIHNNKCVRMSAIYLLSELADSSWSPNKTNTLKLRVRPKRTGEFPIYVRSAMACDIPSCFYFPDPLLPYRIAVSNVSPNGIWKTDLIFYYDAAPRSRLILDNVSVSAQDLRPAREIERCSKTLRFQSSQALASLLCL